MIEGAAGVLEQLGPFDAVLDVGGNVGDFAETARGLWPAAAVTSFEPVPGLSRLNRERARGRWVVEPVALSSERGVAEIRVCVNQHSASTMQTPGPARRERFGIVDRHETIEVPTRRLDDYLALVSGKRALLKIDVEGHEGAVLAGGPVVLARVAAAVVEIQNAPDVFLGAPPPAVVDELLRAAGLRFSCLYGALVDRAGMVVQFDAVYVR